MSTIDLCKGRVCGQIQYETKHGNAHSDICFRNIDPQTLAYDFEYVKRLHDYLDDFLANAREGEFSMFYLTTDADLLRQELAD